MDTGYALPVALPINSSKSATLDAVKHLPRQHQTVGLGPITAIAAGYALPVALHVNSSKYCDHNPVIFEPGCFP
jgi:hypothetical protein